MSKAFLTISRTSADVETIRLRVTDDASGTVALQLELTPEDLGLGLTGQVYRPCEAKWTTANIGRAREGKSELVPYRTAWSDDVTQSVGERRRKALAPFEVDGWIADRSDLGNPHKGGGAGYRVTFVRFAERYEGERADIETLKRFARECPRNYAEGHTPEIAAVLQAAESYFNPETP